MSTLETILTRAMSDPAFADALLADPEKALAGYNLTPEELASLRSMTRADFGAPSTNTPEERQSMALGAYLKIKGQKTGGIKGP